MGKALIWANVKMRNKAEQTKGMCPNSYVSLQTVRYLNNILFHWYWYGFLRLNNP